MKKIYGIEISNTIPHIGPTIGDINHLLSDFPPIRTAVFNENPLDGLFDYDGLFKINDTIEFIDNVTDYISKHTLSLEEGLMYAWKEVICKEFLNYIKVDWITAFLFTENCITISSVNKNKWLWVYNCVDGVIVEIFSPNIDVISAVKKKYPSENIEYPGKICESLDDDTLRIIGIE